MEDTMATKKTTAKKTSPKRVAKPATKKAPAKTKAPTKQRPPKEDLCVFALRMTEAERTKLPETAGPRGAARLARAVLVAAANENESGFRAALKEAAKLRA